MQKEFKVGFARPLNTLVFLDVETGVEWTLKELNKNGFKIVAFITLETAGVKWAICDYNSSNKELGS